MANGCSAPRFAQVLDWALRKACEVSREACNWHDARYWQGGTLDEKLAADIVLCGRVYRDLLNADEDVETAEAVCVAFFRGLQTPLAFQHWYCPPPTVERGPQEA
jgi:hypothetical protein